MVLRLRGPLLVVARGVAADCGPGSPIPVSELPRPPHVARSGLGKIGSRYLFRHTCATLLLEHGADIRHVQEQLGHACL